MISILRIDKILKVEYLKRYMKSRRGQVTIFIIIAIVIIVGVIVFFAVRGSLESEEEIPQEVAPIVNFVQECMDATLENAVYKIAEQGGYYNIPKTNLIDVYGTEISLYYLDSEKISPSLNKVEKEIEDYFSEYMNYCLNFSAFEEQGFQISKKNLSASGKIGDESMLIKMNFPLAIKKGESVTKINRFEAKINSNIKKLHEVSEEIVNSYGENPGFVCLTCIEEIASKYNLEIKAAPLSDINVILFSVADNENELKWIFAVE